MESRDRVERIKLLMRKLDKTQQEFAEVLGISAASLSSILNDRTKPTINHIDAIREKFPYINVDWLLYGKEPMFFDGKSGLTGADGSAVGSGAAMGEAGTAGSSSDALDLFNNDGSAQIGANDHAQMGTGAQGQPSAPIYNNVYGSPQGQRIADGHRRQDGRVMEMAAPRPERKITEIRIFFDDQTWETFVPKK